MTINMQSINTGAGKAEKPWRQNNQRLTQMKPSVNTTWLSSQRKIYYFSAQFCLCSHWEKGGDWAALWCWVKPQYHILEPLKIITLWYHPGVLRWGVKSALAKQQGTFNLASLSLVGRDRDVWRSILFPRALFLYEEQGLGRGCTSELLKLGEDQLFKQSRNDVSCWHAAENTVKNPGYVGTLWELTFL